LASTDDDEDDGDDGDDGGGDGDTAAVTAEDVQGLLYAVNIAKQKRRAKREAAGKVTMVERMPDHDRLVGEVGRCKLTGTQPVLNAPMVSAIGA